TVNVFDWPADVSPPERLGWATTRPRFPACAGSMRPPPRARTPALVVRAVVENTSSVAVVISADLTIAGVHHGWSCSRSAAAPATCGVAMLVPETEPKPVNGPGNGPVP